MSVFLYFNSTVEWVVRNGCVSASASGATSTRTYANARCATGSTSPTSTRRANQRASRGSSAASIPSTTRRSTSARRSGCGTRSDAGLGRRGWMIGWSFPSPVRWPGLPSTTYRSHLMLVCRISYTDPPNYVWTWLVLSSAKFRLCTPKTLGDRYWLKRKISCLHVLWTYFFRIFYAHQFSVYACCLTS